MIRLVGFLLLLAGTILAARAAAAHAVLLESSPADGAVLAAAPREIVLRFDEPVTPIKVEVLDSAGRGVGGPQPPTAHDNELHLLLAGGLAQGSYLVTYRVTSIDSHVVGGSIVFSIGLPSGGDLSKLEREQADRGPLWPLLSGADRLLLFVGLIGAAGGVMFHVIVGRDLRHLDRASRRGLVGLAALGIAAALLGVGIEGAQLEGSTAGGLLDIGLWSLGESTSLGFSLSVAGFALILMIIALWHPLGAITRLAFPAALAAVGSLALTGHALTAGPRWLTAPLLILHVLVAAFWLGALLPLLQALRHMTSDQAVGLLRRFSTIAIPAVLLLVAVGATMAFLQLSRLSELFVTDYGLRLLSKLAFVAALLLIAALNRLWLTPALAAGRAHADHRLRTSIGLEIGLGLAILAATSSLGEVPPPRALIAEAKAHLAMGTAGFSVVTFASGRSAAIEVSPAARGANEISVHLFDAEGKPLNAQQVTIELLQPSAGVEPMSHPAMAMAPGVYHWAGALMPLAGNWKLRILVLVSDFEEVRFETFIPIR